MLNWEQIIKEEKIIIRHFYYKKGLIATLIYNKPMYEGEKIYYGLAVVCPKDIPSKKRGREIAYGRFKKAICFQRTKESTGNKLINIIKYPINIYSANSNMEEIHKIIDNFKEKKWTGKKSYKKLKK